MRVYEMTNHPVAREMIGYLLVRGSVHILAYAKALEVATGTTKVSRKGLRSPNMRSRRIRPRRLPRGCSGNRKKAAKCRRNKVRQAHRQTTLQPKGACSYSYMPFRLQGGYKVNGPPLNPGDRGPLMLGL
ncbi:hypothetical protein PN4B1_38140 [Paenibacillus naphthalenovorans]|nr:hypothetical protein PN4B1_38140 [Paenibacillus naphthalenovorans]